MDHENGNILVLGLVEHAGVEVVDLAVVDGGVRHLDNRASGKLSRVQDLMLEMLRV